MNADTRTPEQALASDPEPRRSPLLTVVLLSSLACVRQVVVSPAANRKWSRLVHIGAFSIVAQPRSAGGPVKPAAAGGGGRRPGLRGPAPIATIGHEHAQRPDAVSYPGHLPWACRSFRSGHSRRDACASWDLSGALVHERVFGESASLKFAHWATLGLGAKSKQGARRREPVVEYPARPRCLEAPCRTSSMKAAATRSRRPDTV